MTIEVEHVRQLLVEQLAGNLQATVFVEIAKAQQKNELLEVTFAAHIHKHGTDINRRLFFVLNENHWDDDLFRKMVREIVKATVWPDLQRTIAKSFEAKSNLN